MLRVLTLSTLFPNADRPNFGIFVELQVVAPIASPPWPFDRLARYRDAATMPPREIRNGLIVHRPRFIHLPGPGMRFAPNMITRALLPMLKALRRDFRFDVIDAEFFWPDGPAAAMLGTALGVPVSIKARGGDIHHWGAQPWGRRQLLAAGQAARGMLAVSGALKRDMAVLGLPEDRISVHYTGVDLDRFVPAPRPKRDGPLLITVGYLIERKGQAFVIDALRELPDARLMLIGDGPARLALQARIAAAGLQDRIEFTGSIPHAELPALFAGADVMVLPSASEGLANVWVEALACGTPIVIADVGGAREVVDRPAAGRIVDRTPEAIAAGVRAVLADPIDRQATRAVAERFTWNANSTALHAHLSALVER